LSVDDLEPLQVDLRDGPHFLIVGPPRGGKSTLLRSWLVGLSATLPASQLEIVLCDVKDDHPALPDGASPRRVETSCLSEVLDGWERSGEAGNRRVLAIDDLDTLLREADSLLLERLTRLIQGRYAGVHLLVVATTGCLSASYDGLGRALKQAQTGFLLGGSDYEDLQALGLNVPHAEASQGLAPGRGYYARHKRYVRVKIAEPPAVPN
jgi:S-DNA-T family DNA segregation ATPase FtsK/SpoIIIE